MSTLPPRTSYPKRRPSINNPSPQLREAAYARAEGRCERCSFLLDYGWELHHRRLRSAGGRNELANLVALCSVRSYLEGNGCHEMVHNRRALLGEPDGWIIPAGQDPAQVPILHHRLGRVLLTAQGYEPSEP